MPDKPEPRSMEARNDMMNKFPRLRQQPHVDDRDPEGLNHPYRLYRFMVPPKFVKDRSIAFVGMMQCLATSSIAHVQALWISAFFGGKLERIHGSEDELHWQTMLHTQWAKLRYPAGSSYRYPDFVFDSIPYSTWTLP